MFVRVFINVIIMILGGILFASYEDKIYYLWLGVVAFLIVWIEFLYINKETQERELSSSKDKISSLTILKRSKSNVMQVAVFPEREIIKGVETQIKLFITSSVSIETIPNIKIITKSKWSIKVSNQVQRGNIFADKHEYILSQSDKVFRGNRFVKYSLFITFEELGKQEFEIVVDNGEFEGVLHSSFTVNSP